MATEKETTEVATVDEKSVDMFGSMLDEHGDGMDNVDRESVSVPFLKIAQPMSPVTLDNKAKAGEFYNSISGEVYGSSVRVVFLDYNRMYVEWEGEGASSRFAGSYTPEEFAEMESELTKSGPRYRTENGNQLVDTRYFVVYLPDHPDSGVMMFSLSSTGITHSRKILSMANAMTVDVNGQRRKCPLWGKVWKLETVKNKNDQGQWWTIGEKGRTSATPEPGFIGADLLPAIKMALGFSDTLREQRKQIAFQGNDGSSSGVDTESVEF